MWSQGGVKLVPKTSNLSSCKASHLLSETFALNGPFRKERQIWLLAEKNAGVFLFSICVENMFIIKRKDSVNPCGNGSLSVHPVTHTHTSVPCSFIVIDLRRPAN